MPPSSSSSSTMSCHSMRFAASGGTAGGSLIACSREAARLHNNRGRKLSDPHLHCGGGLTFSAGGRRLRRRCYPTPAPLPFSSCLGLGNVASSVSLTQQWRHARPLSDALGVTGTPLSNSWSSGSSITASSAMLQFHEAARRQGSVTQAIYLEGHIPASSSLEEVIMFYAVRSPLRDGVHGVRTAAGPTRG